MGGRPHARPCRRYSDFRARHVRAFLSSRFWREGSFVRRPGDGKPELGTDRRALSHGNRRRSGKRQPFPPLRRAGATRGANFGRGAEDRSRERRGSPTGTSGSLFAQRPAPTHRYAARCLHARACRSTKLGRGVAARSTDRRLLHLRISGERHGSYRVATAEFQRQGSRRWDYRLAWNWRHDSATGYLDLRGRVKTPVRAVGGIPMIDFQLWSLQRRALLVGLAGLAASTATGGNQLMAAIEQNTLKRRGVGLHACEPERAFAGFTLFAPHFVQSRNVYLIDLQGEVVHTWNMPYPPGLSGYLTERGTLFYNGRTSEESFLSRFPFKGGVVLEADWNGKVLWEIRHPDHHHHGILLRNGNVLLHCMAEVPDDIARRVTGGMVESNMQSGQYAPRAQAEADKMYSDY